VVGDAEAVVSRVGTVCDVGVLACAGGAEAVPTVVAVVVPGLAPRPAAAWVGRSRDNAIPAITARIAKASRTATNQRRLAADDVVPRAGTCPPW